MIQRFLFIFLLSWTIVLPSLAEEVGAGSEAVQSDQDSSGEVKIKEEKDETISEFRINGQLYMIRITPKKGTPYYLVDSDGDGNLETRWNELAPELLIPAWVLLRW
jgi:hypothetical protein